MWCMALSVVSHGSLTFQYKENSTDSFLFSVLTLWPVHIWHGIQVTMWSVTFTYLYFISISICMFILLVCVYFMYNIWPVYRATQLNCEYMHIKWCLGKMVHRQYIVKLTVCTDNHWKLFMLLNSRDTRRIHIYHWVNNIIINSILTQWFLLRCVKLSLTYLSAVFIQSFLNCKA